MKDKAILAQLPVEFLVQFIDCFLNIGKRFILKWKRKLTMTVTLIDRVTGVNIINELVIYQKAGNKESTYYTLQCFKRKLRGERLCIFRFL